jgi:predicted dehydrogenase
VIQRQSMPNIVIIGAGQLGRRHMQSLANSAISGSLHIVDPVASSLTEAQAALTVVKGQAPLLSNVHWHSSTQTLPKAIDLAVIATTADVRLDVISALFESAPPRYLVLEKVLFQRFADYDAAAVLLQQHGTTAWVNCPRRAFPIYQSLARFFADDPVRRMDLHGGDWGLGCNAIHFLDLLALLGGPGELEVHGDELDPGVHQSKRKGFVEFSGTLRGKLGKAAFGLTSIHGSSMKHLIALHGQSKSVIIDETAGVFWRLEGTSNSLESFSVPYQSQLTGPLAESILRNGSCPLTPYAESSAMHLRLLSTLARHAGLTYFQQGCCPIT